MRYEPALRFWLRYAEREGALVEDAGDHAVAVLPEALQAAERLPEELTVTSDPDVAREDGALLLIAGHPALERAAAAVLREGDVGHGFLPWPTAVPPKAGRLEELARERLHVEHGRIDADGHARSAYAPLLRVGAMVSHRASLTQRVQEQEDVTIDARTGLALPASTLDAIGGVSRLPAPDRRHGVLDAALTETLPAAHAELERRAVERSRVLQGQTRRALAAELSRADAYFADALDAIERRRASAPAERRRLLDAQHERTRAEHARRRREIEEEYRAGHEIRPFRLHLLHVPALVLDVEIRRGSRAFPFTLTWLLVAGAFCPVRCAHCGAADALVAGRERLGCAACLTPPAVRSRPPDTKRSPEPAPPRSAAEAPAPAAPAATGSPGAAPAATPSPRATRAAKPPSPPRAAPPRRDRPPGPSIARVGNKLAFTFWQAVADGERWPRKKVAPHSPLSAIQRLYGAAGPLCALGLAPGSQPSEFTAGTHTSQPSFPELTTGALIVGSVRIPYGLTWWLEAGKPIVAEVDPGPSLGRVMIGDAPTPRVELDPVAAALWSVELPVSGLPSVVRGLATWWRIESGLSGSHEPGAVAGAVAAAVSRASALGRRRGEIAELHGVPLIAIERVEREAGKLLKLDRDRGW